MKLYHQPMTRSIRVRWMLEELGLSAELVPVNVFVGEGRKPEYKKTHPHGFVPALEVGDQTLIESAAICMFLADQHPEKGLAPAPTDPLRGKYYQWMVYVPATCDPQIENVMFHTRFLPEEKRLPALVESSKKRWARSEQVLTEGLGEGPFMLGERFSAADILVTTALGWARMAGIFSGGEKLEAYLERTGSREAFARAMSDG